MVFLKPWSPSWSARNEALACRILRMLLLGRNCATLLRFTVPVHTRHCENIFPHPTHVQSGMFLVNWWIHLNVIGFRNREARQPRFPMHICDKTFNLVDEHMKTLDYDGPVALSCDDTKLFATFRLYWDSEEMSYFLVGGTDGPLRVADPDKVREVIEVAKAEKATKVNFI